MSDGPRAWVLNLDAEHELETPRHFTPSLHLRALVARERRPLIGTLVGEHDVLVTEEDLAAGGAAAERARGLPGIAWSPTPNALRLLHAAGTQPLAAPDLATLRVVNARPFAAFVRAPLQGASFDKHVVNTLEATLTQLSLPAPNGWLVRRTFGAAGRGRRRIASGTPNAAEIAWLTASLRLGALVIEPWIQVTAEYTRSAWVHKSGDITISAPCRQATNEHGAWLRTALAARDEVSREDDATLEAAVAAAGSALAREGYFGPFGIDAYRHRALDGSHATILNPLSEINARFTMDWATAMAVEPRSGDATRRLDGLVAR